MDWFLAEGLVSQLGDRVSCFINLKVEHNKMSSDEKQQIEKIQQELN